MWGELWIGLTWLRMGSTDTRMSCYYSNFGVHTRCSWVWANFSCSEITVTHTDIVHFVLTQIADTHKDMQTVNIASAALGKCSFVIKEGWKHERIPYKVIFMLTTPVCCDRQLTLWVSRGWRFKDHGIVPLLFRVLQSKWWMKAIWSLKMAGTTHTTIRSHIIWDQIPQQHRCENIKYLKFRFLHSNSFHHMTCM
jgi:hypothetical protein